MKTLLFLHWRNFGDAVIGLGLVEAMRLSRPHVQIDILTRPEFAFLYQNHPSVRRVYTASFPIGTMRRFTLGSALHLVAEIFRARRRRYDAVANLFGDVRENLAGRLIAPRGNYSLVWPRSHPVSIQSRTGPVSLLSHPVVLPQEIQSVYAGMGFLSRALGAEAAPVPRIFGMARTPIPYMPHRNRIGLHVSAGQECKRWPMERWVVLAARLLEEGRELRIYCAPDEREAVQSAFHSLLIAGSSITIVAGSLEIFLNDAVTCAIFLGHDSFGIHAANALSVPTILINGPNIAQVWAPPGTVVLHGDETLSCYPCYGKPICAPGPGKYACIRAVSVDALHDLVQISL
jgi:ADP-heptose:LPS heptosyltransferase